MEFADEAGVPEGMAVAIHRGPRLGISWLRLDVWAGNQFSLKRTFLEFRGNMFYMTNMKSLANLNLLMFGRAYRAERRALGKTQQEVASVAGCRRQTIAELEAGGNVSLHTVFAALAALGKSVLIVDARPDLDRLQLLADPDDED